MPNLGTGTYPGPVIAHQGGWDEVLLVVVPMVLVASLLWLAKLRVNRAERSAAGANAPRSDALDTGAHGGEASD